MAGPKSPEDDSLARARKAFTIHAPNLPRQPSDRELYDVAYAVDLASNAPPREVTHGGNRLKLAETVRVQLEILPEMIALAEGHTAAAKASGRRADMERFAAQARTLLEAAEAIRPILHKTDVRRYFHGPAQLLATTLFHVFHECGKRFHSPTTIQPASKSWRNYCTYRRVRLSVRSVNGQPKTSPKVFAISKPQLNRTYATTTSTDVVRYETSHLFRVAS